MTPGKPYPVMTALRRSCDSPADVLRRPGTRKLRSFPLPRRLPLSLPVSCPFSEGTFVGRASIRLYAFYGNYYTRIISFVNALKRKNAFPRLQRQTAVSSSCKEGSARSWKDTRSRRRPLRRNSSRGSRSAVRCSAGAGGDPGIWYCPAPYPRRAWQIPRR